MDFAFTKEQDLIRKSVREFFEKECPKDKVRELKEDPKGYDPSMWKKMAKLGYLGLVMPEAYGGTEGDYLDLMIFMEEMGRNIVPCPYYTGNVLCLIPILRFGSEEQKQKILPRMAQKGEIWTFAQLEEKADGTPSDIAMKATLTENEYLLNGQKRFIPYANSADKMLVAARTGGNENDTDGITLFIVDMKSAGIDYEIMPTAARDMRCQLTLKDVRVPQSNVLGEVDGGWNIISDTLQYGAVFKAAEISGAAQAALDLTVKYTKERKQFNKPIGSLQAIQHKLVELLTDVEGLKLLVYEAVWNINSGSLSKTLNSMVKIKANSVCHNMGYFGIFLHGAIGWTEEMDISLYHIRARANICDGGGTDFHFNLLGEALGEQTPVYHEIYPPQ